MILITGVSGFIGKHLLSLLIEKLGKENILALTSNPISQCPYLLHNNYKFESNFFIENGYENIETIINAGAFTPKKGSEANNMELCNSNIINTEQLLKANLPDLKRIIYLSTIDVYGNDAVVSENTLEKPVSLYGYSKLYSEKMIENWGKEFNKTIQILRIGHVYGPGEEAYQKIIPVTINKIIAGKPIQLWGGVDELRSFIYIKDVVQTILNATYLNENIGVVNIVGNQSISINKLINKIKLISKSEAEIEKIETNNASRNLVFDNSKMMKFLLEKETALDQGLIEEFEYLKNLKKN